MNGDGLGLQGFFGGTKVDGVGLHGFFGGMKADGLGLQGFFWWDEGRRIRVRGDSKCSI
jgi:hypothetical protein